MKDGGDVASIGKTAAAILAVVAFVAARGRVRRYEISERSMMPALRPGDYVVALARTGLERGDVVIYDYPDRVGFEVVKRVIGLPGEVITIENGGVCVDGIVLAERWADGPTRPDGEWPLRRDEVFVLGDNRMVSSGDSRTVGPISLETVGWTVAARYWPLADIGRIS